jgi:PKD-like domain/Secretion system C-terminal sorting domain/FG-GAP-like repeat
MKKSILILFLAVGLFSNLFSQTGTVGMWYSTWYIMNGHYIWNEGHGLGSNNQFLGDVNGDGKDDAIAYFGASGAWYVSLSNGSTFDNYTTWVNGHGTGSNQQFLADFSGDGKADALALFNSSGSVYIAMSNGSGFNNYSQWTTSFGVGSTKIMAADVNGDGKTDLVAYFASTGTWKVALSNGSSFNAATDWVVGHGVGSIAQFLGDFNGDGKADALAIFASGDGYVALSNGTLFDNYTKWSTGFLNTTAAVLIGDINNDSYDDIVFYSTDGVWDVSYAISNNSFCPKQRWQEGHTGNAANVFVGDPLGEGKNAGVSFLNGVWNVLPNNYWRPLYWNLWDAWNIRYLPLTLGSYQQYDSGNPLVIREHLAELTAAKVDYLLLDETNRIYAEDSTIFNRAQAVAGEIKTWNNNPANKDIYYAYAVGGVQFTGDPNDIEYEAQEVWNNVVNNADNGGLSTYFMLEGKPLLVVYYGQLSYKTAWEALSSHPWTQYFTMRWCLGTNGDSSIPDLYGWGLPNGSIISPNLMEVMPGWNNKHGQFTSRTYNGVEGDFYRKQCWDRVLTQLPTTVIINSYNEFGEETGLQRSNTSQLTGISEKWSSPDMYWNMTVDYINQYKTAKQKNAWEFTSDNEGWIVGKNVSFSNIGGAMAINVADVDPSVILNINPNWIVGNAKYLALRVKNTTADNAGQIFFFHSGGYLSYDFPLTPNDTEYKDIYIDLTQNPLWTSSLNINQMRLDVINGTGGQTGMAYVDFVRFASLPASGAIIGASTICPGQTDVVYSIPAISGATGYTWAYTGSGLIITAGANTNTVTVKFSGVVTPGNLSVCGTNAYGSGLASPNFAVAVSYLLANAGVDKTITYGTSTTLAGTASGGSGNYSYAWSPASLLVNANVQNPTTTALTLVTDYVLLVTDNVTNCKAWDYITVSANGSAISDWQFPTNGNLQGWTVGNKVTMSVANSILTLTIKGTDPYIYSPTSLSVNAASRKFIKIRMKNNTTDLVGKIYFETSASPGISEAKSITFPITASDATYKDYLVDMSANTNWASTITRLRFDPISGTSSSTVLVDYITIPVNEWHFATNGSTDGWTVGTSATIGAIGSILTVNITGSDPNINSPAGLLINGASQKYIRILMKNNTSDQIASIYFETIASPGLSEAKRVDFAIVPNDVNSHEYIVDMSSNANWTSTVTNLRLDPIAGPATGSTLIDYIKVTSDGVETFTAPYKIKEVLTDVIQQNLEQTGFEIYPNPVNDELTIRTNGSNSVQRIEIFNMSGQSIHRSKIEDKAVINMSQFHSGFYFVKLYDEKSIQVKIIVKQ